MTLSFVEILEETINSGEITLPPFNKVVVNIRNELAKENPDIKAIERETIKDQSLTAQVLRIANSPFYKGMKEISTVHGAIIRLGANEIANIVTLCAQRNLFKTKNPELLRMMNNLWVHSVSCAVGSHWLARHLALNDIIHEAFFAGLMHDVGKLFLLKAIEDIKTKRDLSFDATQAFIEDIIHSLHSEQGYKLLKNWNLPSIYCNVARDHHNETQETDDPLLLCVKLTDKLCHKCGFGCKVDSELDIATSPEATFLEVSDVRIAELEIKIEDAMNLANTIS